MARWLADPVRGPLSPDGFYRSGALGQITDTEDGRIVLDECAMNALRGLPEDRDGHVCDDDGPVLWIGQDGYRLTQQAEA